jgi:hypothetical protein
MSIITLPSGHLVSLDEADLQAVSNFIWNLCRVKHLLYARATRKYGGIYMHEVILGKQDNRQIDHVDGNGLNNCRSNLRFASHSQNQCNRHKVRGSSRFKGVCWSNRNKKWRASIRSGDKYFNLGHFTTEEAAALAYDQAARQLFGEFARLNYS